jgi:hypothetical protein
MAKKNKKKNKVKQTKVITMPRSQELIKQLEEKRGSKVISYIVSTRRGSSYQIADDAVRIIYNHILSLKTEDSKLEKIDLFIHSFGGAGTVPWKLVNLIREHTKHFEVLVPYKAYSAATLISIGADKIVMHPMAELGPIDPKVGNEFNPITPQGQSIGINVEDVVSYVNFAKELVGINHEDELIQALNTLTEKVHPLALGNVQRFYAQSRMMARKLLSLHMNTDQKHIIDEITETLTSKLFFHGHPINRMEAKELKLKVDFPEQEIEKIMWELFTTYESELEMDTTFDPLYELTASNHNEKTVTLKGACVESLGKKDVFEQKFKIMHPPVPQNAPIEMQIQSQVNAISIPLSESWESIKL